MITIVLGFVVLGFLVVFHESGHFLVARAMGVRAERFSIGFGPVIFSRTWKGTEFAISAFPLGGYVKMGGDDPRHRENLAPGDFFAAAWWRRVLIALAGPGANFVLAILLSTLLLWVGYREPDWPTRVTAVLPGTLADSMAVAPGSTVRAVGTMPVTSLRTLAEAVDGLGDATADVTLVFAGPEGVREITVPRSRLDDLISGLDFVPAVIGEVAIGTPAYTGGITAGDKILSIDGEPVTGWRDLQRRIAASPEKRIVLGVERNGREVSIPVTPAADRQGETTVGRVGVSPASPLTYVVRRGPVEGIVEGTRSTVMLVGFMFKGIGSLFSSISNLKQVAGPVAIIQSSGSAAASGLDRLLDRAILFSVALMVFNLLPVPILDGGMVVLAVWEALRRRPVGNRGLAVYQGIGMAVLGTLLVFVLINDPLRILQRRSALGRIEDVTP